MRKQTVVRAGYWLPVAVVVAGACGPSQEVQRQLAELSAISAQKDTLLMEVAENARLMSEVSAEIARVQAPAAEAGAQEAPIAVTRENLLADIQQITARLGEAETKLAQTQQRIETMGRENARLGAELKNFQRAVLEFQGTVANQKETIGQLTAQVNALQEQNTVLVAENTELAEEKVALVETVDSMSRVENTVYYVIGTKDELIERGIVTEEGGSRVLFVFGKRGKTLVPARNLDPSQFIAIDKRFNTEIPMPWMDRDYRIASRQDLASLASPPDENGEIRGVLRIADPERFWATNRYLIIVQS